MPEILVGPYRVGWDTIAFYVLDKAGLGGWKDRALKMLEAGIRMYMIGVPVSQFDHTYS